MTVKKAPPKKKAVKKHASKKKIVPNKKKTASKKKAVVVSKVANKKVPARQSPRMVAVPGKAKRATAKKRVVKKKAPIKKKPINKTEERYKVFAYKLILNNFNGTKAAEDSGYSKKTAPQQASRLLNNVKVQGFIATAIKERTERTKIDADWLLKRLADEVKADVSDLYYENGGLKPVHEWPKIWRLGLVGGMDVEQQYMYIDGEKQPDGLITKIKLSDRTKRLEMIGKHIDVLAFLKQVEVTKSLGLAERLRRSRDRAQGKRGNSE